MHHNSRRNIFNISIFDEKTRMHDFLVVAMYDMIGFQPAEEWRVLLSTWRVGYEGFPEYNNMVKKNRIIPQKMKKWIKQTKAQPFLFPAHKEELAAVESDDVVYVYVPKKYIGRWKKRIKKVIEKKLIE